MQIRDIILVCSLLALFAPQLGADPYAYNAYKQVEHLNEEMIGDLPDDSELLKKVYAQMFLRDAYGEPHSWWYGAQNDIKKRANRAMPVLLQIFEENVHVGGAMMSRINLFLDAMTCDMKPMLEKARKLYGQEGLKMAYPMAKGMSNLLASIGDANDVVIIQALLEHADVGVRANADIDLKIIKKRLHLLDSQKSNLTIPDQGSEDASLD